MKMVASDSAYRNQYEDEKTHIIVAVCSAIRTVFSSSVLVQSSKYQGRHTTRPSSSPVYTFCAKGSIQVIAEPML